jgi:hypothetical protein
MGEPTFVNLFHVEGAEMRCGGWDGVGLKWKGERENSYGQTKVDSPSHS